MNQDRFIFRVFDKSKNSYLEGNMAVGNGGLSIVEMHVLQTYEPSQNLIIEQCSGLKDKNGNLIYEGDVLKCESKRYDLKTGEPFIVYNVGAVKREPNGKYYIESDVDKPNYFYGTDITFYNERAEIIGNIHETKGE